MTNTHQQLRDKVGIVISALTLSLYRDDGASKAIAALEKALKEE